MCEWDPWCTEEPFHGGFPMKGMFWGPRLKIGGAAPVDQSNSRGRVLPSHSEYYMGLVWWMPCGQGSWSQFQGYWDWCFPSSQIFDIHSITRDQSPVPSFDAWTSLSSSCWSLFLGFGRYLGIQIWRERMKESWPLTLLSRSSTANLLAIYLDFLWSFWAWFCLSFLSTFSLFR